MEGDCFFFPSPPSFPRSDGNAISEPAAVQANPGHLMYSHAVHLGVGAHISIRQAHARSRTHAQARIFHGIPHSAFELPLCTELPVHGKKMHSLLAHAAFLKCFSDSPSPICFHSKCRPPKISRKTSFVFFSQMKHKAKRSHVSQSFSHFIYLFILAFYRADIR